MPSFRPMPGLTLATLLALAVLGTLGTWQMQRLAWKVDLIAQVEARVDADPVPLDVALRDHEDIAYMPVAAQGTFDHRREIHLFGRNLDGHVGYYLFTPLLRQGQPPILINRGHVLQPFKEQSTRAETLVTGMQRIEGLARLPDTGGWITPAPNLESNEWYARDVVAMAEAVGLEGALLIYIEAFEGQGEILQGGQTRLEFRNDHLGYAMTWYGLAIVMLGVYIALHIRNGRLSFRQRDK